MRPLKSNEMEQLTKLWTAFMQDPAVSDLEFIPDRESTSRWQEYVKKHLDEDPRQVLVAEEEGKIVGYLLYRARSETPITRRYDYAMISDVYVVPELRRRGIAANLMKTCLRQLGETGATHVRLHVSAQNEAAKSLYRKYGFAAHNLEMQLELQT